MTIPAELYGIEHFVYIGITAALTAAGLILAKKYAVSERARRAVIKGLALALFVAILTNRLSHVFRYEDVRWREIIPDSYCGLTSLALALAALFGKRDNVAYHFLWHIALFGGISTIVYPSFIGQGATVFYLPIISDTVLTT